MKGSEGTVGLQDGAEELPLCRWADVCLSCFLFPLNENVRKGNPVPGRRELNANKC